MKNAIEEEKVVMTADEAAFIDRFVAEHCRPHAVVMAERLRNFVAKRQMALFAADDGPSFALAAGPAAKVPSIPIRSTSTSSPISTVSWTRATPRRR